jgi:hypothetical protein
MSVASRTNDNRAGADGVQRQEYLAAAAETLALLAIFVVAITGRDAFGEGVKLLLTVLTVIAGSIGALGGLGILRRAFSTREGRVIRIALSGWMLFAGIYSVVHVLS